MYTGPIPTSRTSSSSCVDSAWAEHGRRHDPIGEHITDGRRAHRRHVPVDEEAHRLDCCTRRPSSHRRPAVGAVIAGRELAVRLPAVREQAVGKRRPREDRGAAHDDLAGEAVKVRPLDQTVGELDDLGLAAQGHAADHDVADAHPPVADLPSALSAIIVSTASPRSSTVALGLWRR